MLGANWAIFISGRGSNAQCLFDEISELNISLVVSSRPSAIGLLRARRSGVPTLILDKEINWQALSQELKKRGINKIFLLGFMRLLSGDFVHQWAGQIYNLHPSLLPAFPGKEAIKTSFEKGASMGVSVHEVIEEMDAGPIICQKKVIDSASAGRHSLTSAEAHFLISRTEQFLVKKTAISLNFRHNKNTAKEVYGI